MYPLTAKIPHQSANTKQEHTSNLLSAQLHPQTNPVLTGTSEQVSDTAKPSNDDPFQNFASEAKDVAGEELTFGDAEGAEGDGEQTG